MKERCGRCEEYKPSEAGHTKGTCQKRFSGFCLLRGGYPPFPLSFFEHNVFPLRGGVYPPIPLRKKSAKNGYIWPKNANAF